MTAQVAPAADGSQSQNFTNNLLGCTPNAAANLSPFNAHFFVS
jgi:hypothetical protein